MKLTLALACLLLPLIAAPAFATDVTVTCTAPTTRTDGVKLVGALTFNLYGAAQGQPKVLLTPTPLAACSSVRLNVKVGVTCWDFTAVEARNDLGPVTSVEGLHSTEACTTVAAPPPAGPAAPTNTTATPVAPTAYSVIKSQDALVMIPVGVVGASVSCDTSQAVQLNGQTFRPVPVASVKFTGSARPIVTFAICG